MIPFVSLYIFYRSLLQLLHSSLVQHPLRFCLSNLFHHELLLWLAMEGFEHQRWNLSLWNWKFLIRLFTKHLSKHPVSLLNMVTGHQQLRKHRILRFWLILGINWNFPLWLHNLEHNTFHFHIRIRLQLYLRIFTVSLLCILQSLAVNDITFWQMVCKFWYVGSLLSHELQYYKCRICWMV